MQRPELLQYAADVADPLLYVRIGNVGQMDEEVSLLDLFQGRAERIDQVVRQLPDEADRVRQECPLLSAQRQEPDGRIERGEELVLDQDVRPGQAVEER